MGDQEQQLHAEAENRVRQQMRFHYACPCCKKVTNRLKQHLKLCKKRLNQSVEFCKQKALQNTATLMKNQMVNYEELKEIVSIKGDKNQYKALQRLVQRHGLALVGKAKFKQRREALAENGSNEGSESSIQSAVTQQREKQKRRRVVIAEDETASVESTGVLEEDPVIYDPSDGIDYESAVRQKVKAAGLYRRFNLNCHFLLQFNRWKEQRGEKSDNRKQDVANVSRVLAFIFEQTDADEAGVNELSVIIGLMKRPVLQEFFKRLEKCKPKGETIRLMERAIQSIILYMRSDCVITHTEHQDLEVVGEYLKARRTGTSRQILVQRQEKVGKSYRKNRTYTIAEVRSIFRTPKTKQMLKSAKDAIRDGQIKYNDYTFIMRYCMAILQFYYGLRPQVCKNLRVREFANRTTDQESGITTFGIEEHKTSATRPIQQVGLEKKQEKIFRFYLNRCRQAIAPIPIDELDNSTEPFFIGYSSKKKVGNCSREVVRFQRDVESEYNFTSNKVRHIIETESRVKLANNQGAREAIHEMAGHSKEVARRAYIDPTPRQVIPAIQALKALEANEPVDIGEREIARTAEAERVERLHEEYPINADTQLPTKTEIGHNEALELGEMNRDERTRISQKYYDVLKNKRNNLRQEVIIQEVSAKDGFSSMNESDLKAEAQKIAETKQWRGLIIDRITMKLKNEQVKKDASEKETAADTTLDEAGKYFAKNYTYKELKRLRRQQNWPGLEVRGPLGVRGMGVFTTQNIGRGQLICDYKGVVKKKADHDRYAAVLERDNEDQYWKVASYRLEYVSSKTEGGDGESYVLEAHEDDGSYGRLINHSKKHPNVKPVFKRVVSEQGKAKETVYFYTIKRIKAGQELLWDYGPRWQTSNWYNSCPCKKCDKD